MKDGLADAKRFRGRGQIEISEDERDPNLGYQKRTPQQEPEWDPWPLLALPKQFPARQK
jgi:hypothetical protein